MSGADDLPPGWLKAPLGQIVEVHDNKRVPVNSTERENRRGPYPYFGANGQAGTIDGYLFDGDFVLLAEDGGYFDDPARGVAYRASGRFWVNNHAHILKPKVGVDIGLLEHLLNAFDWMPYVTGTTRLKLTQGAMVTAMLPLPPVAEQRRIVAKLEDLLARSRRAKQALDKIPPLLETLRRSILAAAFRGDLTAEWRAQHPDVEPAHRLLARIRVERRKKWEVAELARLRAKGKAPTDDRWKEKYREPEPVDASELPELPEGWAWAAVEEIGTIESGQTTDGLAEHKSSRERHVPWFRVGDMNNAANAEMMREAEVWLSSDDVRRFGLHVRPAGTIIFPKRGGAIATNKKRRLAVPSAYDLNTMGVIPADSLSNYLWSWFLGVDLGRLNTGSAVPQINHGDIAPLPVPLAPLEESALIAQIVMDNLAAVAGVGTRVAAMDSQLQAVNEAILSKAFRGELVPQDPNDEPAEALLARLKAATEASEMPSGKRLSAKNRAAKRGTGSSA